MDNHLMDEVINSMTDNKPSVLAIVREYFRLASLYNNSPEKCEVLKKIEGEYEMEVEAIKGKLSKYFDEKGLLVLFSGLESYHTEVHLEAFNHGFNSGFDAGLKVYKECSNIVDL